ncbi:hypothetical protein T484DRAFT_1778939 [Baffinella frigidus]|nr:hypothetical protein T484DRAFT_1778939 [Cryptophyta sp. CCMP2293]
MVKDESVPSRQLWRNPALDSPRVSCLRKSFRSQPLHSPGRTGVSFDELFEDRPTRQPSTAAILKLLTAIDETAQNGRHVQPAQEKVFSRVRNTWFRTLNVATIVCRKRTHEAPPLLEERQQGGGGVVFEPLSGPRSRASSPSRVSGSRDVSPASELGTSHVQRSGRRSCLKSLEGRRSDSLSFPSSSTGVVGGGVRRRVYFSSLSDEDVRELTQLVFEAKGAH